MKFLVSQTSNEFSFVLTDDDGNQIGTSSSYENLESCIASVRSLVSILPNTDAYQLAGNTYTIEANGIPLLKSIAYPSADEAQSAMEALIEDASDEAQYTVEVNTLVETTQSRFVELPSLTSIDYATLYDFSLTSNTKTTGIEPLQLDENTFTFLFNGQDGEPIFYSRKFDSATKRDKRIRQIIKAAEKADKFEVIEENGSYYFIIKAVNNAEIARSKSFTTAAAAQSAIAYCQSALPSFEAQYPEPVKRKRKGNTYDFSITANAPELGFHSVKNENKEHFFLFNDENGHPLFYSQGYAGKAGRDNGILTVIKNAGLTDQHEVKEIDGNYYFILRSANRQEIARSIAFDSAEAAQNSLNSTLTLVSGFASKYGLVVDSIAETHTDSFVINVDLPKEEVIVAGQTEEESKRNEDEYLDCSVYHGQLESPEESFTVFEKDGSHYFSMNAPDGEVLLRSESYPNTAVRDNGIQSVLKNREIRERYKIVEDKGEYFVALKAANHKEIARSCPFETETAANAKFAFLTDEKAHWPWLKMVSKPNEDEYLDCGAYLGHVDALEEGFTVFEKDGSHYFSMNAPDGEVLLRSESYPNTAVRDNGIQSVLKNREIRERYKIVEDRGEYFVALKAANHKEIARSCPFETETAANAKFAFLTDEKARWPWLLPLAAVALGDKEEDNYLACKAYQGHTEEPVRGFHTFLHDETGEHYFSMFDERTNEVILRSEGYATPSARDNGIESVLKNRDIKERYSIEETEAGHYFVVLKAANHKEIARSCGHRDKAGLFALFPFLGDGELTPFPWQLAGIGAAATTVVAPLLDIKDEPKTPPTDAPNEKDHSTGIAAAGLAAAAAQTHEEPTGEASAKGTGAVTAAGLAAAGAGLAAAAGTSAKPTAADVKDDSGYRAAAPLAAEGSAGNGGGLPRWLLALLGALLLGALLWWLLKGCDNNKMAATDMTPPSVSAVGGNEKMGNIPPSSAMATDTTTAVVKTDTTKQPPATPESGKTEEVKPMAATTSPATTTNCGCDNGKNSVFMRYTYDPIVLKKLGSNTEFGDSHGLTPSAFYDKLNNAYQTNQTDKAFLNSLFKSMGYKNGWDDATPSLFSEATIPYGTVGNIGYSKQHRTQYSVLNLNERDQKAFRIKAKNGCDVHFMKTCGNHMFYCSK